MMHEHCTKLLVSTPQSTHVISSKALENSVRYMVHNLLLIRLWSSFLLSSLALALSTPCSSVAKNVVHRLVSHSRIPGQHQSRPKMLIGVSTAVSSPCSFPLADSPV